jgi:hypothetical protein
MADASYVAYLHRSLGCPVISTLLRAVRRHYLDGIPRLTPSLILCNPPLSPHTSFGHLDLIRQGLRSSKPKPLPDTVVGPVKLNTTDPSDCCSTTDVENNEDSNSTYCHLVDRASWHAADLTGRFPIRSRKGNEYVLVTAHHGYIHVEPQPSRQASAYVKSFTSTLAFFHDRDSTITDIITDNERSDLLTSLFRSQTTPVTVQYVSPQNHRANPAERAIRTFKNHFIAILSTVHIHFPLHLWDHLLPHAELTLNLLRSWTPAPHLSAWHGLNGHPFDFSRHPLHPPGQLVVAHDSPTTRPSWAPHGERAYYLGPSFDHYRCHNVYIVHTGSISRYI